jgi:CRP-like cAMP-binding protein
MLAAMQVLSEVRRRRKNQRERARSLSPAKDYTARQRSRLSSLPHLQLQFIPKFILSGAESEPSSPIDLSQVSPKGFKRRLWERLHFQGNKHEWFSRTKFAGCLREEELDALFEACTWRSVSAGEAIFLKGDSTASGLVMVVDGTLGVYGVMDDAARGDAQRKSLPRRSSGSAVDVEGEAGAVESGQPGEARELLHYELIPGESIGDIDLLYARHSRSFTVRASTPSTVLQLSQASTRTHAR